jgi:oxygen-dependent protoporphyrinogen oxidase
VIAIVGGGITGLAAAHELHRRHTPFVLLEASSRVGGLIHTEHIDGFTIEAGADSILAQKRAALDLCDELGLGSRLMSTKEPRTAYVMKRGRLYPLPSPSVLGIPLRTRDIASYALLSPGGRARLALEPWIPRAAREDESVRSFFTRRFGSEVADTVADPLLGGIHAGDISRLSVRSLFPRLVNAEAEHGSVLRMLRAAPARAEGGAFRALPGGMGELTQAIVARLPPDGVRPNARATSLARRGEAWEIRTADDRTITATSVIITAPAFVAADLFRACDPAAADLCAAVPYVSTATAALSFARSHVRHPLRGSGFVVARAHNDRRITACTWVSSKWEGRAPAGHVLLRAFFGGAHDQAIVDRADEELVRIAIEDLQQPLGLAGTPELTRVYRWRNAGAQHHVGQLARMVSLDERLRALPGLFVAGSGFRAIGIPDCVADGRAAAARAADYVRIAS